ncbi:putative type IX secretion system sortase PorU2 [Pontibacter oryzae]|nr:C25 family cysteine peptidase [Pontibacter oryzae]
MKRFLTIAFTVLSCCITVSVHAQQVYGNEWIDYSKTYHKLKVVETGLYKLNYTYLKSLGLENVNPQHLQLFRRGREVAIYVEGEADGRLDAADFLEFYGERNDGVLDQELYKNPAHQVHQLHSMYTDTAAYFLTVNPAGGNRRMQESNPAVAGRTPEPYHLQKATNLQTGSLQLGQLYGANRMPWMDRGEGYFSSVRTSTQNFDISGVTNVETTGPLPWLTYVTVGPNDKNHLVNINLVNGTTRTIHSSTFGPYEFAKNKQQIQFSDIITQSSKLTLQLAPQTIDGAVGAVGLAYASLMFPQKTVFSGKSLTIYTDSLRGATPYFEFTGAPSTLIAYDVTDQQQITRTAGYVNGTKKGFVLNGGPIQHKVLLARTDQALVPAGLPETLKFRKYNPADQNFVIITNKKLMQPAGGSVIPAPKEYAAYRSSAAGGGYDTLLVFVSDLVNQFHYGEFSSNALRRLSSYLAQSPRQKFMLYMGKGYEIRMLSYKSATSRALDLVPTGLGTHPGSDILFSADFRNDDYEPRFPTGRLLVTTPDQIIAYLNKVKEYEAAEEGEAWRKNLLLLGGGKTSTEINQFTNYINNYAAIASGPLLGANPIKKTRQNLSEVVESIDVSKEINEGVSMITFFGHSSPGTTDLDIGFVSSPLSTYRNKGRYPIIVMNGCNVGDVFSSSNPTFGEDWLNTADRGAVALMAHIGGAYPTYLNLYTSYFYTVAFQDPEFYGKTLGEVQKEAIKRVNQTTNSIYATAMVLEVLLQGDPALKIYNPSKPDYLFAGNSFDLKDTEGNIATASSDTLVLSFDARNLGKAIDSVLTVSVKRTLPDNSQLTETAAVGKVYNSKKVELYLSNKNIASLGMNTFEITLDSPNKYDELHEDNNTAVFQKYVSASGLSIVSPAKYSIVGGNKAALTVQAGSTAEKRGVYYEIDTTSSFNSPWLKKKTGENSSLTSWEVDLLNNRTDSLVYFWRARFSSYVTGEDTVWVNSSFRNIAGVKSGWSQSHKGQFSEINHAGVDSLDQKTEVWKFGTIRKFINIRTAGGDIHFYDPPYGFFIDGNQQMNYYCGNPTYYKYTQPRFYIIAFNNITLEPLQNVPGQGVCTTFPHIFDSDDLSKSANVTKLINFINSIPANYYVAVIGMQNIPFTTLPAEAKAAFRSIGSSLIDKLKNGDPFAMVGQKGAAPGTAQEMTFSEEEANREGGTPASSQSIELDVTLLSNRQAGTLTSTTIGPALSWGAVHHTIKKYGEGDDKYTLSLIGVDASSMETVLEQNITTRAFSLSHINAAQYPNLKLAAFLSDSTKRTAPQLKEWFVLYEAAPEGIIRPDLVKASSEELSQLASSGTLTVPMAFQNVTGTAFSDSVTVEVSLSGEGIQATTSRFKIKPIGPNETVYFSHTIATQQFDGDYKLSFYVNPRILPEQEYGNNIYEVSFKVNSKLHPIMDVAFDGIHIMDGDIVSPSPLISVTVKDENQHVFLQDPSKMSLVLISPEGQEQDINLMGNAQVTYTPATESNDFQLEYRPEQLLDGKYKMEVRAQDAAGKESGVTPYRIGFEVVSESSVSNFYPFPNPFSTKTNFIFTITGSTIPEHMKIQILTITGKVIKEIMKEELGPLRIGNNKTEYAWDGTDMYGDKLANGVYLYRVIMSKGEDVMKHRNTFGDGAFKNGYGKLYILR